MGKNITKAYCLGEFVLDVSVGYRINIKTELGSDYIFEVRLRFVHNKKNTVLNSLVFIKKGCYICPDKSEKYLMLLQ